MIGQLIAVHKECLDKEIFMRFCNIAREIMTIIEICKLHENWQIYGNQNEALKAFDIESRNLLGTSHPHR